MRLAVAASLTLLLSACITAPAGYQALVRDVVDTDGDGYAEEGLEERGAELGLEPGDCDDEDPDVNPGADDVLYDGVDDDCDAFTSDSDGDGDGFDAIEVDGDDCDDTDPSVNPAADESWYDGVDQDCTGGSDYDADGDGEDHIDHGGADCDDDDPEVTGAFTFYEDLDGDGYGTTEILACAQPADSAQLDGDCDDSTSERAPDLDEECDDGLDNDCDDTTTCRWDGDVLLDHGVRLSGDAGSGFGNGVAPLGDVDGDGVADFILGAPNEGHGCAHIYRGGTRAPTSPWRSICDEGSEYEFAYSVGGGRDADLDGANEYLVGESSGAVYLYDGASGTEVAVFGSVQMGRPSLIQSLSGAPYPDLLTGDSFGMDVGGHVYLFQGMEGGWSGSYTESDAIAVMRDEEAGLFAATFGTADLSGDGLPDVAVGDPDADAGGFDAGAVFVFEGPVESTLGPADASTSLLGEDAGDKAGSGICAGDLDGDGAADLVVTGLGASAGTTWVLMSADQPDELADAGLRVEASSADEGVGYGCAVGDFDGDGAADLALGTPANGAGGSYAGGLLVVWGPASGTALPGTTLAGDTPGELAGFRAANLGDFDGDGTDDLLLTATASSEADGAVYLIFGRGL